MAARSRRQLPLLIWVAPRDARPIGGDLELRMLRDAWRRAERGQLTVATLLGEPGAGKTFLARAFARWAIEHDISTVSGYCSPTLARIAFAPLVPLLHDGDADPPAQRRPGLEPRPKRSTSGPLERCWGAGVPTDRARLLEDLTRALCPPRPRVIVLDDLHWADQATLEWIEYVGEHRRAHPLLLVLTVDSRALELDSRALELDSRALALDGRALELDSRALELDSHAHALDSRALDSHARERMRTLQRRLQGLDEAGGGVVIRLAPLEDSAARTGGARQGGDPPGGAAPERRLRWSGRNRARG